MHASGTGKAILAALPREVVVQLLQQVGLLGFTDHTHVTTDALFADLDTTRERGWSFDCEERFIGMSCVGSAIYDETGQPVAGVSISGQATGSILTHRRVRRNSENNRRRDHPIGAVV